MGFSKLTISDLVKFLSRSKSTFIAANEDAAAMVQRACLEED